VLFTLASRLPPPELFFPHSLTLPKSVNLVSWISELNAKAVSDLKDSKLNYLPIAVDL